MAASLILFASGLTLGQWMGARSTTYAFMQVREQDAAQLALRIQETGSAYVAALAALGELPRNPEEAGAGDDLASRFRGEVEQGREVALGALYGAANELARLHPEDTDLLRVLQILEGRRAREQGLEEGERNVVWF